MIAVIIILACMTLHKVPALRRIQCNIVNSLGQVPCKVQCNVWHKGDSRGRSKLGKNTVYYCLQLRVLKFSYRETETEQLMPKG